MTLKHSIRLIFTLGQGLARGLPEATENDDPLRLFEKWFRAAEQAGLLLPESMTLATATKDGIPSARMVLLKSFDEQGFVFYTNYGSRKAAELDDNPRAALVFYWAPLQRQVRVEGTVSRVSDAESVSYFDSRPRGSRIGAWASRQSAVLSSRAELEDRVKHFEREFAGAPVPLPPFWGGYRVDAQRIEFWQGRASRLHDRVLFVREGGRWKGRRLYP